MALSADLAAAPEQTMLVAGPDGRNRLYVAQPYAMEIVIGRSEPDRISYAWWWGANGDAPTQQSKADVRRHESRP